MREISFGAIREINLGCVLSGKCEVMRFDAKGKPHCHDRIEVAFCISGWGIVWIGENSNPMSPGDYIRIPPNTQHYMHRTGSEPFCMLIAYEAS